MQSYLNSEDLLAVQTNYVVPITDLLSTDTYNETKIKIKIQSLSQEYQRLLLTASVQLAIIGFGNKQFGSIMKGDKPILLTKLFDETNVLYKNVQNSKLKEDDLTPRRLIRFFRYHIHNFIKGTQRPSYLWNKYANKSDQSNIFICFPGAEHFITEKKDINFLIETYRNLDLQQNTKISERIYRVFQARGIMGSSLLI